MNKMEINGESKKMKPCGEPGRRRFLKTGLGCLVVGWLGPLRTLLGKFPESERKNGASFSANLHHKGADMPESSFEPAYLKLHQSGELKRQGEELWQVMKSAGFAANVKRIDWQESRVIVNPMIVENFGFPSSFW